MMHVFMCVGHWPNIVSILMYIGNIKSFNAKLCKYTGDFPCSMGEKYRFIQKTRNEKCSVL